MILALDAALHAAVAVALLSASHVFKTEDNSFPVDGSLVSAWALDWAAATAAVAVLALLLGSVVQSKKYFRYKYEGERGIRALRDMIFYVYCVTVPVPFFRLTF
jgi:hypothetical protein